MNPYVRSRREGFALALTIIVIAGVAVLASGAMMVGMNTTLIRHYNVKQDELTTVADAGSSGWRPKIEHTPITRTPIARGPVSRRGRQHLQFIDLDRG